MTLKEEREYGIAGKEINGRLEPLVVIFPGKEKKYGYVSKVALVRDRYGNVVYRHPNPFMKAEIVYSGETDNIEDLIFDLERAGFVIIWFRRSSESTFARDILSTSAFPVPA
jgi:hypothetical protein